MKILQNEPTNNTTTTSTTTVNSKEKQQHQQPTPSLPQQQQITEKRKAKTLKNKILQNVAKQQQQQEQYQQQRHQQTATVNNKRDTPSAMTDERLKFNSNNICNNKKTNNSITADINNSSSAIDSNIFKDTINDSSAVCNIQNKKESSNSSDLIIAEAAKILLKNGLNGTRAVDAAAVATATATLLTAAANFHQLPTASNFSSSTKCDLTPTSFISSTSASETPTLHSNVTTAAATAHAQLVAIAAAAAAVTATNQKRLAAATSASTFSTPTLSTSTCKSSNETVNNGLLDTIGIQSTSATTPTRTTVGIPTTSQFTKPYKTSSCKNTMSSSIDMDIFDHTVNLNSNNATVTSASSASSSTGCSVINLSLSSNNTHTNSNIGQQKFINNINSNSNRSDISRPPIPQNHHHSTTANNHKNSATSGGYGGRLQFFKDGKFILELARSKDGEKGGWVSVPRKIFRTPSAATSSTVTPSASASTSVAAIPSSLAASPAAVIGGTTYPKNECSNSLSFSDDNSSLQSSPWQRDHCWKQAAPRKNVSKELKLFYRKPANHKFTTEALALSQRKCRKPYDTKTLAKGLIFALNIEKQFEQNKQPVVKSTLIKKELELKEVEHKSITEKKDVDKTEDVIRIKSSAEIAKTEIIHGANNTKDDKDGYETNSDNKVIKTETEDKVKKETDVEMAKISSPSKSNVKDEMSPNVKREETNENEPCNKMNSSECADEDVLNPTKNSTTSNGEVSIDDATQQQPLISAAPVSYLKKGDEEKRLKKQDNIKTRAKLTTIVQKLIDVSTSRLAACAHRLKASNQSTSTIAPSLTSTSISMSLSTSNNISLSSLGIKNQNSKVSPPSNAAASRLVEYHQQHVSPRKRILREFEKVLLEDNSSGASVGKRSRPKGSSTSAISTNSNIASSTSTTTSASKTINTHNSTTGSTSKSAVSPAPTKLYSSYSIHSLLGGGLSTSTVPTQPAKKSCDLPATITSSSLAYSPYHHAPFPPSSLSNNSPTSPENSNMRGGKSPTNSATKTKRSPPYSSPMRETPSISPITCASGNYIDYGGRRSPRLTPDTAHNSFNKMRYNTSGGMENMSSTNIHHLQHQHHLQQHYQQQPQTYYSPYMMSPHYVPPLSSANALSPSAPSANAAASATASSRSPRHLPSAFRATTPTSALTTTHNIPTIQKGDLSPQRSTTASPRETTPRTVPKKTASIRRQFASPTSASTQNHNVSNCSSPITTIDEQLSSDRRTPGNSSTSHQQHQQQHLLQRGSPGTSSLAGSPIHPYSYLYTQQPNGANSSNTSNATISSRPSSSMSPSSVNASAAVVAAAAAAAASYIPAVVGSPYYHPYISTLAAMRHPQMFMQHYQNAAAAAANPTLLQARHPAVLSAAAAAGAAARLSPPYHGFQYNGVGNAAALAAAAAAAAGFGSTVTPTHSSNPLAHTSSMFHPMANNSLHGLQHSATAMQVAGLVPASAALPAVSPMTDTTDFSKSSKNNFTSSPSSSTFGVVGCLSTSSGSPGNSMYTISNKDEQSSDVPLNLSKH